MHVSGGLVKDPIFNTEISKTEHRVLDGRNYSSMNELDTTPPGPAPGEFELGEMIGLRKAFGSVAGRCSAAAAASIKRMRDQKLFKSRTETWEQFCPRHLGMTSV